MDRVSTKNDLQHSILSNVSVSPAGAYDLLGRRICAPNPTWETELSVGSPPYLGDHQVNRIVTFPTAGYIDAMLSAHSIVTRRPSMVLEGLEFQKVLRVDSHTLRVEITDKRYLSLYSRHTHDDNWSLHAKANLSAAVPKEIVPSLDLSKILGRCDRSVIADSLYVELSACGLHYGPSFRTIKQGWQNSAEVVVEIVAHPSVRQACHRYQLHPTLLNAAFQSLAAIMPGQSFGASYVPMRIERMLFRRRPTNHLWSYGRLTRVSTHSVEADITLCNDDGLVMAEIRKLRWQRLPCLDGEGNAARSIQEIESVSFEPDVEPVAVPDSAPFALHISQRRALTGPMFRKAARRAPRAGEVELRIDAASLNFKDVLKISGRLPEAVMDDTFFGTDIGMEAAATVVQVGDGVEGLHVGDSIVAMAKGGCFRSHLAVSMDDLFWLPILPGRAPMALVGMPIVFATALYSLRDVARLRPGERVLLHSAAGGVGLAALQVARSLGAEVLATAGSPEKRDYLQSLGIRHVMESRSLDFYDEIMALSEGRGIDVVLNFLPGEALEKSVSVLAACGRLIEIGKHDIESNNRLPLRAFNKGLSFTAVDLDRLAATHPGLLRALLLEIWDGIREGLFEPVPIQVFPISEIAHACRVMLKANHIGKIVLRMQDKPYSQLVADF